MVLHQKNTSCGCAQCYDVLQIPAIKPKQIRHSVHIATGILFTLHIAVISGQQGRNSRPVWAIIGGQAREENPVADFSGH